MSRRVLVRSHEYYDSVRLMQVSERVRALAGVREALLVMATDNNKRLLQGTGLLSEETAAAGPNDLVLALAAEDEASAEAALLRAEEMLRQRVAEASSVSYRTLDSALAALPDANLALISVPGQYAAAEARRALERGLHVFLFSDNVSVEEEVSLKALARERGLLVMGPDCGTALVNGVGLGFANAVRRGPIGLVGASGTGLQQITSLIHRWGSGVSHALGTGGRDLSGAVVGATMLQGIGLLEADEATRVIVLTSKPPAPAVAAAVLDRIARCTRPVVVNFLGGDPEPVRQAGAVPAATLEEAAREALRLVGGAQLGVERQESRVGSRESRGAEGVDIERLAAAEAERRAPPQKYLRGLFSGGTLGYEALLVLRGLLGDVYSNIPLRPDLRLADPWSGCRHSLVDLGEDEFTRGRPHPMIDPTLRAQRILAEAADPEVAALLLDVVLGHGSHPDPAGSLAEPVRQAQRRAAEAGRHLAVVASVCGTEEDPQGLAAQERVLREAGVLVLPSNVRAARVAGEIARRAGGSQSQRPREHGEPTESLCDSVVPSRPAAGEIAGTVEPRDNLLRQPLQVVNVGLEQFARSLTGQGVKVAHVEWKPPAQGDPELMSILDRLL